jgi:hypothetical protein
VNRRLRTVRFIVLVLLISVPISVLLTLLLVPFWRWLEAISGFESIGHSGPAEWCYIAVFAFVALGTFPALRMLRSRHQSSPGGK